MLFRSTIGLRLEAIMVDILHTVDQGVASHIVANIFWEVIVARKFGPTIDAGTEGLFKDLKSWYASQKGLSPIQGKLIPERIRTKSDWPKLKAKAAATRHLSAYAVQLAVRFNSGSMHDRRRLQLVQDLEAFYQILASEEMFLSPRAKESLPKLGRRMMGLYTALAEEAASQNVRKWKMTAKFHLFQHLLEWQCLEVCNPRFYWVYADEDLQRHVTEIASSCHSRTMCEVSLYKWMVLTFDLGEQ